MTRPLITAILLTLAASAQQRPSSPLLTAAATPDALARYVSSHREFDWQPLWNALHLEFVPLPPCSEPRDCITEMLTESSQTILVIDGLGASVYISYASLGPRRWVRTGAFVARFKDYPRRREFLDFGGRRYLRISSQGVSGSNLSSEEETWFDLTGHDFRPAFAFTRQGYEQRMGFGISRTISSTAVPTRLDGIDRIQLSVSVRYALARIELGEDDYRAIYQRDPRRARFEFQSAAPARQPGKTLAVPEFESQFDLLEGSPNEALLIKTLPRLRAIATGTDPDARDQLRILLQHCNDTAEKRELLNLLARPH